MLLAFWFGLPLLMAFAPLTWFFVKRGLFRHHFSRAVFAFLLISLVSIVLGVCALAWSPPYLRLLGVKDVFLADHYWPVLPLAFVSVTIVAPIIGWWALQVLQPNPSFKRDA